MKKRLIICTFALITLISAYGISYYVGRYSIDISYGFKKKSDIPKVQADAMSEIIVSNLTDLYIQTVDINSKTTTEEKIVTPVKYIGLTRKELQVKLDEDFYTMDIGERLKGLISIEIVNFEKTKVVIRKTYSDSAQKQDFYLYEKDGKIVIYLGDKRTIYDYTDIAFESLDFRLQRKILKGYYVKDSKELYDFLQNHTS